jgi:hypothetical protein
VIATPEFLLCTLRPALAAVADTLALPLHTPEAELQLLVTAMQETGLRTRVQDDGGPGRSFFQLEAGLDLVAEHPVGKHLFQQVVAARFGHITYVPPRLVRAALADPVTDYLACQLARLLLWLDPHPLPPVGDEGEGWDTYIWVWRPGVQRRSDWARNYPAALSNIRLAALSRAQA